MALIIKEGFDTYDSADSGAALRLHEGGWMTSASDPDYGYIRTDATVSGKRLNITASFGKTRTLEKNFPALGDLCVGAQITKGSFVTPPTNLYLMQVYGSGTSSFSLGHHPASDHMKLVASPSLAEVEHQVVIGQDVDHYYEIRIQSGVAELFVDGVSVGTADSGVPGDTYDTLRLRVSATAGNTSYQATFYYDHLYLTDLTGVDFNGRLGPIAIIPLIPTSDGSAGSDFSVTPPGDKFAAIDDNASGGTTDQASYIQGNTAGQMQTFGYTSEGTFTTALGYFVTAAGKAECPTGFVLEALAIESAGTNEVVLGDLPAAIGEAQSRITPVETALPGGVPLTQANFELLEFGYRLKKLIT